MRCSVQTILYVTLTAALGSNAYSQRGFSGFGGATLPSSTARGAGAVTGGRAALPSSTAIGAGAPSRLAGSRGTFNGGGYYSTAGSRRTGERGFHGDYRRVPYQYFVSPYYYPFLDYGSAPYGGAPEDLPDDPNSQVALIAQNALGEQVQRLTAEIEQLKYSQQQPPPQASAAAPEPPSPPVVPITLVLRNGQKLQVQNYAVMDQTFWDFSRQPVQKIPVSSIDLSASSQASAASGAEFPQIRARQ